MGKESGSTGAKRAIQDSLKKKTVKSLMLYKHAYNKQKIHPKQNIPSKQTYVQHQTGAKM